VGVRDLKKVILLRALNFDKMSMDDVFQAFLKKWRRRGYWISFLRASDTSAAGTLSSGVCSMSVRVVARLSLLLALCSLSAVSGVAIGREVPLRQSLVHDGMVRSYIVRVPSGKPGAAGRMPLVIVLHGGGGNAEYGESMSGFTPKGAREGFVVAYPDGSGRMKDRLLTWNARHCCGYAMQNRVDDVGFINALIDRLVHDYPVDPERVYVTGMSNGGMMAHRLGSELSHRIAAIAPVAAAVFGDEKMPDRPVSALMINGMLDQSVPHRGGAPGGAFPHAWDGTPVRPAPAQAEFWARANRCDGIPTKRNQGAIEHWRYNCPAGIAVELHLLADIGHAWPGGRRGRRNADDPRSTFDATDVIWAFFRDRTR
jgi:polyhydroxybutyrate depolymerase